MYVRGLFPTRPFPSSFSFVFHPSASASFRHRTRTAGVVSNVVVASPVLLFVPFLFRVRKGCFERTDPIRSLFEVPFPFSLQIHNQVHNPRSWEGGLVRVGWHPLRRFLFERDALKGKKGRVEREGREGKERKTPIDERTVSIRPRIDDGRLVGTRRRW